MFNFLKKDRWSPYLVGAGFGVLLLILLKFERGLGTCSGINKIAALVSYVIAPDFTTQSSYFGSFLKNQVVLDWKLLFIIGLFFGALIASKLSPMSFIKRDTIWTQRFGTSKIKRHFGLFFGSVILMFGMRVAGGCLTGHGLQGVSQMSLASVVFILVSAITSTAAAFLIYRIKMKGS